jgi:crotonobetainyl-CoA:carnitine CoA-transferase CaiB-like acyl-CoA transferase
MTPQAAFEALTRSAAIAPLPMPSFDGPEAVVPSPYKIATAVAAALGYAGAAAAEVWRFRGGDRQEIGVDLKAAAALTVPEYKLNGMAVRPGLPHTAASGFYQSADRHWLHLGGGFSHLKLRTLELLNAADTTASVMEAVAKWNALALEDALGFLGLCGAVVRSESEWNSCIPGRLAVAPIVLTQVAPGPPFRPAESATPLGGLKVLDLTRVVAGPLCTRILGEHGAEVLSIAAGRLASAGALDTIYTAGKRQAQLDLAEPSSAEVLRRLARQADVFVESYRPGALTALGFSSASLAHLKPGMITVSISAYGLQGPWAGRRGFEETVEAASGLAAEQGAFMAGRHDAPAQPELLPGAVLGTLTGVLAAAGVLAALLRRIREGGSWHVEVSLAATAAWLSSLGRIDAAAVPEGFEPLAGLDQYLQSCETKDGWFEFLGPVVRMAKTPPRCGALPEGIVSPHWASAHEEANAAEIQSAQT